MKYVVKFRIGEACTASAFDTHDGAVDYINDCIASTSAEKRVVEVGRDHFLMVFTGDQMDIQISKLEDSKVKYDLVYIKNGQYIETRRFSKRILARDFAHKIIYEHGLSFDPRDDNRGAWFINDSFNEVSIKLQIQLVILDKGSTSGKNDYKTLEISPNASDEEIKTSYRKLSKKYHPDRGGDPKKFQEIHEAYDRITSGKATKEVASQIVEKYESVDMRLFMAVVEDNLSKLRSRQQSEVLSLLDVARVRASMIFFIGLFGGIIGYAMCASGFYLLGIPTLIFGVIDFIRGFYYMNEPEKMIKKK